MQESTIDLTFSTPNLTSRLKTIQIRQDWGTGEDHHPILLEFDLQPWRQIKKERYSLKKLDKKGLRQHLLKLLQKENLLPTTASIREDGEFKFEAEDETEERIKVQPEP